MSRHVIVHAAVSVDGATTGFEPDTECFYALAARWAEDVTLVGADTILAQEPMRADGPLLAVVDGRRRVSQWDALRECGHWRDVLGLHPGDRAGGDPASAYPRELLAGVGRVDLAAALDEFDGEVVRVDSGGSLNGALLQAGLVDEVSLLVHPCIVGEDQRRWYGQATRTALEPLAGEMLEGRLAWLRYRVGETR